VAGAVTTLGGVQAKVIVVPQGNISDIERICRENPNMQEDTR
jgi:hypothetical protein